jgi:hypothetical protein
MAAARTSHENCYHPKTKSARAACRRAVEAYRADSRKTAQELIDGYYSDSLDSDSFAYAVIALADRTQNPKLIEAKTGYYNNSLEIEDMANLLFSAKFDL